MRTVDGILIALIVAVSLFLLYGQLFLTPRAVTARIYENGIKIADIDRGKDARIPIIGGKMHIEVRDGSLRIADSNCPGQCCVRGGWINKSGQSLVCAPNRVSIELTGGEDSEYDALTR